MPHRQKLNVAALVRREVDERGALPSHPRRASHAMHERRRVLRRVELHHPVHARDVQPSSRDVRAQQTPALALRESRQRRLALRLFHLPVQRHHRFGTPRVRGRAALHRRREVIHARAREEVHDGLRLGVGAQELTEMPQALVHRARLVHEFELRGEFPARGGGRRGGARRRRRRRGRLRGGVAHRHAHRVS